MNEQNKVLVEFVKQRGGKRKGQLRGVVVAKPLETGIGIGWSYTNLSAGDVFDKERALNIAFDRANVGGAGPNVKTPREVLPVVEKMVNRATKYFKQFAVVL